MPKSEEKKRGGVIRYRTIELADGEYAHVAIVRKEGKRGGRTVMGPPHKKKEKGKKKRK